MSSLSKAIDNLDRAIRGQELNKFNIVGNNAREMQELAEYVKYNGIGSGSSSGINKDIAINLKTINSNVAQGDDDTLAINNAIKYIIDNFGTGTLKIPYGTYKVNGQITMYADRINIVADGAIFDCSEHTDTTIPVVKVISYDGYEADGDVAGEYSDLIRKEQQHCCEGIYFKGNKNITGALFYSEDSQHICTGFQFKNCVFTNFNKAIGLSSQCWVPCFMCCNISNNNTAVLVPAGNNNYGERLTFINCNLHSNKQTFDVNWEHAHIHCIGCSLDYNYQNAIVKDGRVYFTNCHLESTKDTGYLFLACTEKSLISFKNCEFYTAKTKYEMGKVYGGGIICMDGCYFHDAGYYFNTWFVKDGDLGEIHYSNLNFGSQIALDEKQFNDSLGTVTLDGSENWTKITVVGDYYRAQITDYARIVPFAYMKNDGATYCKAEGYVTMNDSYDYNTPHEKAVGMYWWKKGIESGETCLFVTGPVTDLATQDLAGFKTWLASNNITLKYRKDLVRTCK